MNQKKGLPTAILLAGLLISLPLVLYQSKSYARGAKTNSNSALRVSSNGRYFVRNGEPFFWLGDSGWSLFTSYTKQEAAYYLERRQKQGFTVIQVMMVFNGGPGLKTLGTDQEGDPPFHNSNPLTPNEAYFKNADYIINLAREKGLIVYLLPLGGSGGSFVAKKKMFTVEDTRAYGKWLGRRYKNAPNIVWMNGFDLPPWKDRDLAEEFAAGLREGDGGAHLISYAPGGGYSSSSYFQRASWLSFNHIQVWSDYWRAQPMVLADYCLLPVKPTVMAEGAYEAGVEYPSRPITPLVVRKEAYWSYLGGGFHTYGHNDIWRKNSNWRQSLDSPGAQQMGILKKIFTSRKWWKLVPDQSVFVTGANSDKNLNAAARSTDGDTVIVYLSSQTTVSIDMRKITASKSVRATWINPQTGKQTIIGTFPNLHTQSFTTPASTSEDAVLLLDAVPEGKS